MIKNLPNVKPNDLIINCTLNSQNAYITDAKIIRIEVDDDRSNKAIDIMKRAFLDVTDEIDKVLTEGNKVYVHCKMGQQRSCAIIAAYLMKKRKLTVQQAIQFIKTQKKDAFFWQANFAPALNWWYQKNN